MRALPVSLAVLAVILTSGGVAMRPVAEETATSAVSAEAAAEQSQCHERALYPRQPVVELPGPDPNRPTNVQPLNTAGYNYRDPQPGQPDPVAIPASPER